MKDIIDNFSNQSEEYKKFRPVYPADLYHRILKEVKTHEHGWDCGTGNGQVATELAKYFTKVTASDISDKQLKHATPHAAINYTVCRAEKTNFPADAFDLITIAQAIHWFDFTAFYQEVYRVGKPGSIIAVWGYGLVRFTPEIDRIIDQFYTNVIGPYWDPERKYIDEAYQNIPFDFEEIPVEETYSIKQEFSLANLGGYLGTWSSIQKYQVLNQRNPVSDLLTTLQPFWGEKVVRTGTFPIFMRLGNINK